MKYLFPFLLILTLASCKSYIDLKPLSENSVDNFYKTESDINQGVVATYDGIQTLMRPGYLDHFGEVRSDNSYNFATTPVGGAYADFDNFNLTSANTYLNNFWHSSYTAIQRANIVLNRIDAINMDENLKRIRKGEVKFLRALAYFYLVQIWGDVPLVADETKDPMSFIGQQRTPAQQIYNQIITDLGEAAEMLPQTYSATEEGRVTKSAADALLARVYLVRKDFPKVLEYTNKVISAAKHTLDKDYSNIFRYSGKSDEVIFKISFKSGTNSEGFPYLNVNHDYNNTASRDLMESYKNDPRLAANVKESGIKTYYSTKIHNENVGADNTIDIKIVVLRYADILLMKAEALNETGFPNSEALNLLNQVRTRFTANQPIVQSQLSSKKDWQNVLMHERRIEFAFENLRWFDLVRTDLAKEVMTEKRFGGDRTNSASALPYTFADRDLLFPVPQVQIDASGGSLAQNPGY